VTSAARLMRFEERQPRGASPRSGIPSSAWMASVRERFRKARDDVDLDIRPRSPDESIISLSGCLEKAIITRSTAYRRGWLAVPGECQVAFR
jgi:hypothetical protein